MKPMRADEFIRWVESLPEQENIIEDLLPQGETMIIAGEPFRGKSLEGLRLAFQFNTGGDYHGLRCKQCNAAYLTWEGARPGIGNRLKKFANGIPTDKLPYIARLNDKMPLNTPKGYAAFYDYLSGLQEDNDIKAVIVDSFTYTVEGDTRTDTVVDKWWEGMQKLSNHFGMTFIFIWELNKPVIFRGEKLFNYDLSRLKTVYGTAYKVNSVVIMGEEARSARSGDQVQQIKIPTIVVPKAKDCGRFAPLSVKLNPETLCYVGSRWAYNSETCEYDSIPDLEGID